MFDQASLGVRDLRTAGERAEGRARDRGRSYQYEDLDRNARSKVRGADWFWRGGRSSPQFWTDRQSVPAPRTESLGGGERPVHLPVSRERAWRKQEGEGRGSSSTAGGDHDCHAAVIGEDSKWSHRQWHWREDCQEQSKKGRWKEGSGLRGIRCQRGPVSSDGRSSCCPPEGDEWDPEGKPKRLEELPRKPKAAAENPLGDDLALMEVGEEEEGSEEEGEGGSGESGMEKAIIQLTKIASHLTEAKKKDPLEALLDGGFGSLGGRESSSSVGAKKNAAALRALQRCLKESPKVIYQSLESNMQSDFLSRPVHPGEPLMSGTTARGWLSSKSRIMLYQNHVRWVWQVGGIWDCLMAEKYEEARARAGLLVAAADQASIDGGSWLISTAGLLEQPPPYQMFGHHQPPSHYEAQHTALYDPRWMEVFMSHVKELDSYQEARRKLGKGPKKEEEDPKPKAGPKVKAKGDKPPKSKGKGQLEEAAQWGLRMRWEVVFIQLRRMRTIWRTAVLPFCKFEFLELVLLPMLGGRCSIASCGTWWIPDLDWELLHGLFAVRVLIVPWCTIRPSRGCFQFRCPILRLCVKEPEMMRGDSKIQWDGVRRLERLLEAWLDVSPVDAIAPWAG